MFFHDATYILVLIGALLSMWASARVNTTYRKYAQVRSMSGLTGAEAARRILHGAGIYDVQVEHIGGNLTDHYDPRAKVLRMRTRDSGSSGLCASAHPRRLRAGGEYRDQSGAADHSAGAFPRKLLYAGPDRASVLRVRNAFSVDYPAGGV